MALVNEKKSSTSAFPVARRPAAHDAHSDSGGHETEHPRERKVLRTVALATAVFAVPPAAALALGAGPSTAALLLVLSFCAGSHLFMGHGGRAGHG